MSQPRSKFYVQSGQLSWVLLASDVSSAALRFAQIAFQPAMKGQQTVNSNLRLIDESIFSETCLQLDSKIRVSQNGFNRPPSGLFKTSEVLRVYRQQIESLEKLIRNCK